MLSLVLVLALKCLVVVVFVDNDVSAVCSGGESGISDDGCHCMPGHTFHTLHILSPSYFHTFHNHHTPHPLHVIQSLPSSPAVPPHHPSTSSPPVLPCIPSKYSVKAIYTFHTACPSSYTHSPQTLSHLSASSFHHRQYTTFILFLHKHAPLALSLSPSTPSTHSLYTLSTHPPNHSPPLPPPTHGTIGSVGKD